LKTCRDKARCGAERLTGFGQRPSAETDVRAWLSELASCEILGAALEFRGGVGVIDIARAEREAASIHRAKPDELAEMAVVLARAFYDDPVFAWVVEGRGDRLKLFERTFALYLRKLWIGQNYECYTTENIVGVLVCEQRGRGRTGGLVELRVLPSMLAIYGRLLPRVVRALRVAESQHPSEPHYFLLAAGVLPEWQRLGGAAAVLRGVLERCDRESQPAYLDATSPRNRALYERHGFEVTEKFSIGHGSPPSWRMWRDPRG
jgi:GNAT superfamily N-acetyltransferase